MRHPRLQSQHQSWSSRVTDVTPSLRGSWGLAHGFCGSDCDSVTGRGYGPLRWYAEVEVAVRGPDPACVYHLIRGFSHGRGP